MSVCLVCHYWHNKSIWCCWSLYHEKICLLKCLLKLCLVLLGPKWKKGHYFTSTILLMCYFIYVVKGKCGKTFIYPRSKGSMPLFLSETPITNSLDTLNDWHIQVIYGRAFKKTSIKRLLRYPIWIIKKCRFSCVMEFFSILFCFFSLYHFYGLHCIIHKQRDILFWL